MSKPFTYWVRLAMVATMCTLVTFSPVSAGRWMDRLLHRDACKMSANDCCDPIISCEISCVTVPSTPCVVMSQPVCPTVTLGCDSMPSVPHTTVPTVDSPDSTLQSVVPSVVESTPATVVPQSPVVEAPVVTTPKVEPMAPVVQKPLPVVETPAPVVEKAPIAELVPVVPEPKPVLESTPPVSNPFTQDSNLPDVKKEEAKPKDASIDDLFGSEPKPDAKVPPAPVAPVPVDDLFGTDPKPVAGEAVVPKDDLFSTDPKPETPAVPTPKDDLFGTDPEPATPATAAPVDDLFGSDPKPAVPATAEPSNDLFGSDPKPTAPVTAEPVDDLFGDPKPAIPEAAKTKDKPAAEPSIDDLFGKPINVEVDLSDEKSKSLPVDKDDAFIDSLFGNSPKASKSPAVKLDVIDESPATLPSQAKPRSETSPVDELDALFGVGEYKPAAEFKGAEYRLWVDNSGAYQVNARLAVIYVDKIKLLKDNGKFTTVSLSRLSDADFGYVSWVASNLTGEQTARMVKTESKGVEPEVSR